MSTTRAALETACRAALRDAAAATFTSSEVADMIGEGINQLADFYPAEIVTTLTITASTYTYAVPTTVSELFRVDITNASGELVYDDLEPSKSEGTGGGWVMHGGILWLPENLSLTSGYFLRLWGYGPWTYIDSSSATSATTNLDQNGLIAVRKYVAFAAMSRLAVDRAKFQQFQQQPETSDVGPIAILQFRSAARDDWEREKGRLETIRKTG